MAETRCLSKPKIEKLKFFDECEYSTMLCILFDLLELDEQLS